MHVDIPSDQLLPEMEKGIKETLNRMMAGETKKIEVERIEWTAEGLRVWILTKK